MSNPCRLMHIFMPECFDALTEFEHIKKLDMSANTRAVIQKLPGKLKEPASRGSCGSCGSRGSSVEAQLVFCILFFTKLKFNLIQSLETLKI